MSATKSIKIFQIYYNEETKALLDPAFIPLDNSDNPRPDWAEYWPIRKLAQSTSFDDHDLIGVFSPRFLEKTGLTGEQVITRIREADSHVYSFSPHFDQSALHINPFEHGERKHPGLIAASELMLEKMGIPVDIRSVVMDHRRTIFANYFVASHAIWQAWIRAIDLAFSMCEDETSEVHAELTKATRHRTQGSGYEMKLFVLERAISALLEHQSLYAHNCISLEEHARRSPHDSALFGWMVIADSLKGQFRSTQDPMCMESYHQIRAQLFQKLGLRIPKIDSNARTGTATQEK